MEPDSSSPEENSSEKNDEQQDQSAEGEITEDSKPSDGSEEKEEAEKEANEDEADQQPPDVVKVTDEIDQFIALLSSETVDDDNEPPKIPESLEQYAFLAEAKIANYDATDNPVKWGELPEELMTALLENVARIHKLSVSLSKFSSHSEYAMTLNRFGEILQRALSFFEEEFRLLLEDCDVQNIEYSSDPDPEKELPPVNYFPGYPDDIIAKLNRLVHALITTGHETECCQLYFLERRKALDAALDRLGYEKNSIDDVQKKNWDAMERDIVTWIKTYKEFSKNILPSERNLIESIYAGHESASLNLFRILTRAFLIQLLNFSEAVAMTKRSDEKLFKFVDVYEALRDLVPALDGLFPADDGVHELIKSDATLTRCKLGETIICIFRELECKIKTESGKTAVPGGAVHPNTRYTLNYLNLACEYKDTLELLFKEHQRIERADSNRTGPEFQAANNQPSNNNEEVTVQSPFQLQLIKVMDSVDSNLEGKSKLYKDASLSLIFLMNNGRYILQKVKASPDLKSVMGDPWIRKRSSDLRSYHKSYQRETWGKVLQCLNAEGLTVHGKVSKPTLKERFKSFNAMFDEIHKTQSTWLVTDEQLQSELRVSISSLVIPAYRSFMARFSSTFTPGRQTEKYVKYQPEDIETYIDELFDGNSGSQPGKKK
ncbi:Exocyst subunit Exo70 family protein [Heracleum sosnowskyi]|uniref:Exocyst subunit Exo70 family protein n=1 Tax=Heracleum sosnowskyi TaxID=360622 RepID=A0AAD8H6G3_9APIA|nr:Exocyst subunit Exo70 family protein [Heracleum sosnowskyi]